MNEVVIKVLKQLLADAEEASAEGREVALLAVLTLDAGDEGIKACQRLAGPALDEQLMLIALHEAAVMVKAAAKAANAKTKPSQFN